MNPVIVLAKIKIEVPPEAIVPLLIGMAILLVLIFAGAALQDWKERKPKQARTVGTVKNLETLLRRLVRS